MDRNRPKWTEVDIGPNGPNWTKIDKIGPKWMEVDRNFTLLRLKRSIAIINATFQLLDIIYTVVVQTFVVLF